MEPMAANPVIHNRPIAVVDADPGDRRRLASLLERVGFATRTFDRGEALLESLRVGEPVCIISEMALPDMDGLDLMRTLRERAVEVPVIILTRRSDIATAVHAMRNSVADYLTKPYVDRDLVNRLRAALARRGARLN